jgi:hypothetical protein
MPQQHPVITITIAILGLFIIALLIALIVYIFVELVDNICYKPCCKKLYIKCKDKKNGVKVAPEIKIVEAKITILPVTVYAREIYVSDALEAYEV